MRWTTAVLLAVALLATHALPASACDPEWDWCGYDWYEYDWYEPYSYEPLAYEEPAWSWNEWEPAYEPAAVYEPPAFYEPPAVHAPAAVYEPAPFYEPAPSYVAPVALETPSDALVPEPAPIPLSQPAPAPSWSDPLIWSSPGSDRLDASIPPASQPAPAPLAVPPDPGSLVAQYGLHWVDEVWAGDIVATDGLVTTYSSSSVAMNAGTAARVVASVGTGEASAYDGLLFNGRLALSDGRSVKGDIYANYVWDGYDWAFDKYVFFQDDLEIARITTPPVAPIAPIPGAPPPAAIAPVAVAAAPPAPATTAPSGPAFVTPLTGDLPAAPGSAPAPPNAPGSPLPAPRLVLAGVALAPQADPLGRIEVLRGRRVPLWVRATIDGAPARVVAWRLASGELTALGPISGTGDDPLVATWRSIPSPGAAFSLRLRASVELPAEGLREVDATIDVVVRSPALVE